LIRVSLGARKVAGSALSHRADPFFMIIGLLQDELSLTLNVSRPFDRIG